MKLLLENWREYLNEEEWEPTGERMMFPAKYLFSHKNISLGINIPSNCSILSKTKLHLCKNL